MKLALILANMRAFALEQAGRGVAVRYVAGEAPYAAALAEVAAETGPLRVMEPSERELRVELQPLVRTGAMELLPHEGWLTTRDDFLAACGEAPPWRMDRFYRHVRRRTGFLMEDGKDEMVMKAERGFPPDLRECCGKIEVGKCLCGQAAASRQLVFADRVDERHEVHYPSMSPHGHYCVPILSDDDLLGVMGLYVEHGHRRQHVEELFLSEVGQLVKAEQGDL